MINVLFVIKKVIFRKDCWFKYIEEEEDEEEDEEELWCCQYCGKEFQTEKGAIYHENKYCKKKNSVNNCYRCGRSGHYSNTCYAKTHIKGYYL